MEELTRSEANKIWENLTIADNFIFQKVMRKSASASGSSRKSFASRSERSCSRKQKKGSTSAATAKA